jgi:RHS repeat-associated protein
VTTNAGVTKYYYFPSVGSGLGNGKRVAMRGPDDSVIPDIRRDAAAILRVNLRTGSGQYLPGDYAVSRAKRRTNASRQVVAQQLYAPFGATRWVSGTLPTDLRFTGQREDAFTGLVHMGARWYNSRIGRWISPDTIVPDPAAPQDFNRYAYSRNNPVGYIDPSGHRPCWGYCDWDELDWQGRAFAQTWGDAAFAMERDFSSVPQTAGMLVVVLVAGELVAAAPEIAEAVIGWVFAHPVEAIAVKAVAEEVGEAAFTGTPFDPRNVLLDMMSQLGDDFLPRQYSVAYEMELDPADYGRSDSVHFNRANAALDADLQSNPEFRDTMETWMPGVSDRVSSTGGREKPSDWTWHHSTDTGVMQLVPRNQHYLGSPWDPVFHPGGRGGYSIWARPHGAPPRR